MMATAPGSPRIAHISWGRLGVEGFPPFKDAKVFPGGAREWDWRETGTRHDPGIQPCDVDELIEHGAETVVLSKGIWERLGVCSETLKLLADSGIAVEVLQTEAAVQRFNELRQSTPVGGLFPFDLLSVGAPLEATCARLVPMWYLYLNRRPNESG